ncbi:hypothetical protein M407DRAFT_32234 [Tulasnella calospora MUT 4182]|uniref:Uncharacterized protein n=1 Tax=Tulasnella calospora MUT 4182 TaxID=1051891 RepID=A0A0C3K9K9_9AGAM|nr:hypothetical protein M407DRAFT_32234 [Tulasnella calospora MUT 4182]
MAKHATGAFGNVYSNCSVNSYDSAHLSHEDHSDGKHATATSGDLSRTRTEHRPVALNRVQSHLTVCTSRTPLRTKRPGTCAGTLDHCIGFTSATKFRADDYSLSAVPSYYKTMLLTTVIVGYGYKAYQDWEVSDPPPGYNSVIGEVGGDLNYDELVVYHDDAIRPPWLIIYQ